MDIRQLEELQSKATDIKKLGKSFIGNVTGARTQMDKYKTNCIYLSMILSNGETFDQKYTPTQIKKFADALRTMKISNTDALLGKKVRFEQDSDVGKGNPRWYPVEILTS